jgi:molybdopterin molybdotransferase
MVILSLTEAQRLIVGHSSALATETVPLEEATGRIAAHAIKAVRPVPAFARSSMDGYAVNSRDLLTGAQQVSLHVTGEIAAGATDLPRVAGKCAVAIMTGGALPPGANQVVPFEHCRRNKDLVLVDTPPHPGAFIRARGADLGAKQTIVRAGTRIEPQHLPLLAESGLAEVPVVGCPELAIICTGSELLDTLDTPEAGQIVGGNRFLLASLIKGAGATSRDLGLVADDCDRIVALERNLHPGRDPPAAWAGSTISCWALPARDRPLTPTGCPPWRSTMFGHATSRSSPCGPPGSCCSTSLSCQPCAPCKGNRAPCPRLCAPPSPRL